MAWIEKKQRRDGGVSARVVWRLGGTREGAYQSETFGAGSDASCIGGGETHSHGGRLSRARSGCGRSWFRVCLPISYTERVPAGAWRRKR